MALFGRKPKRCLRLKEPLLIDQEFDDFLEVHGIHFGKNLRQKNLGLLCPLGVFHHARKQDDRNRAAAIRLAAQDRFEFVGASTVQEHGGEVGERGTVSRLSSPR